MINYIPKSRTTCNPPNWVRIKRSTLKECLGVRTQSAQLKGGIKQNAKI